jgi:hypothetical protein
MYAETAQEIFQLFDMTEKTDAQIIAILGSTRYDKDACAAGISFIKDKNKIFFILDKTNYADSVCDTGIKALHLEGFSENELLDLIESTKKISHNPHYFIKLCNSYFKMEDKTELQIVNLLKKTSYDYELVLMSVKTLTKKSKKMNDEQLLALIELTEYNDRICEACVPFFKSEGQLFSLISSSKNLYNICSYCAPHIYWIDKSNDQILKILQSVNYHPSLCKSAITHFDNRDSILAILSGCKYDQEVCAVGIPLLRLDLLSEKELLAFMKLADYSYQICFACLEYMNLANKNDDQLLHVMATSSFNQYVCMKAIVFLKTEKNVMNIITSTGYQTGVARAGLPLIKLSTDVIAVMNGSKYNSDVCSSGMAGLKNEEEIFYIMEKTNYNHDVCRAGIKAFEALKK